MQTIHKRLKVLQTFSQTLIRVKTKQPPKQIGTWLAKEVQVLGPTFIKIGQFISSRKDIFGADFASCFDNLRDKVVPISPEYVQKHLNENRVGDMLEVVSEPIASASIGQVHLARGKATSKKVIIKIKRPDIDSTIQSDIQFLRSLVDAMVLFNMSNSKQTLVMLNQFEEHLTQETNFYLEASNIVLFHETYAKAYKGKVRIPYLVKKLSNENMLVMEYIKDVGIDNYKGDRKAVAQSLMYFFVQQLIDHGLIHGDPHKGNIGLTDTGEIILYDYGSVIQFSPEERFLLKEMVFMLVLGNKYGIVDLLVKLGVEVTDREALLTYIEKYMEYMRTIDISVFKEQTASNLELPLKLNGKIFRLLRVYGILEGICKELDPDFNYYDLLDSYITGLVLDEDFIIHKIQQDMGFVHNNLSGAVFQFFQKRK